MLEWCWSGVGNGVGNGERCCSGLSCVSAGACGLLLLKVISLRRLCSLPLSVASNLFERRRRAPRRFPHTWPLVRWTTGFSPFGFASSPEKIACPRNPPCPCRRHHLLWPSYPPARLLMRHRIPRWTSWTISWAREILAMYTRASMSCRHVTESTSSLQSRDLLDCLGVTTQKAIAT